MLSTKQEVVKGRNLVDAFQTYKIPSNISQDYIDPVDGHVHRYQNKYLGVCSLQFGNQVYPQATFYEITESEISEMTCLAEEDELSPPLSSDASLPKGLPPKKRKRRRMIRYDIIFTVDKGFIQLSPDHVFFTLSRDAVTECLTDAAPHKLLMSFFTPPSCSGGVICGCHAPTTITTTMVEDAGYKTKLEEFAAVCVTSSCRIQQQQFLDGSKVESSSSSSHVNNMILSNVSHELYVAIKQMVSPYEILCQNMTELMKLHKEKIVHHRAEMDFLPETAILLPNQSDDDFHASSKHHDDWSSSSDEHSWEKDTHMKGEEDEEQGEEVIPPTIIHTGTTTSTNRKLSKNSIHQHTQQQQQQQKGRGNNASNQIKKCLYCGSKSTPMWRRGPQGAGTLCNACGVKWKHGKILNGSGNSSSTTTTNETTSQQQQQEYTPQPRRGSSNTKGNDKKRKRSSASSASSGSSNSNKRGANKKSSRASSISQPVTDAMYYDTFAVPAPVTNPQAPPPQWEGQSAASSSTTSDSRSPLESFSSSPNTSPSIATLMDGQDIKRDILMSYDTETLSVYVGEDAVEAAAVLTLLKRS